ncbi:MAG: hypothetical protein ACREFI_00075 [Stellaceae bacterium]
MGRHEAAISQNTVELLHTAVPGPTRPRERQERRRHKRRDSLRMKVTFLGADHDAVNWSLGGFLVKDTHPETPLGTAAAGFLGIVGVPGRFAVRIELVRRDKRAREIAWRFVEPSQALVAALTRLAE